MNYLLEGNMDDLGLFILLILFFGFGVPIILAIIGAVFYANKKRKTSKVLFIISVIYLLISLGICGSLMI